MIQSQLHVSINSYVTIILTIYWTVREDFQRDLLWLQLKQSNQSETMTVEH